MSELAPYLSNSPQIHESCFVADSADIMGGVEIGEGSSVWYNCVLRGDVNFIRIGQRVNVQDGTVIHVASKRFGDIPTLIGDDITIGHMALIHACTIKDRAFIGMKACIMDGAVVEEEAMVAAGALVSPGKVVKSRELWAGVPAKKIRDLSDADIKGLLANTAQYVELAQLHKAQ